MVPAGGGRGWFIALAALALIVQVLAPPGFMVAASPAGPALVICTGHGPLVLSDQHHHPAKAPKGSDAPCAFAGHGAATAPPPPPVALPVAFAPVLQAAKPAFDLAPGRGLAAPPPPSHAPPATPI
jgi:hypothetical protein